MTKADIVTKISRKTQVDESLVSPIVESFMATVKDSLAQRENVYLRELINCLLIAVHNFREIHLQLQRNEKKIKHIHVVIHFTDFNRN